MSTIETAIIEAVADAMYPYWLTSGEADPDKRLREALMSVHQNHPVKSIREQAWQSHQFAIDMPIVWEAHRHAMVKRQEAAQASAG